MKRSGFEHRTLKLHFCSLKKVQFVKLLSHSDDFDV